MHNVAKPNRALVSPAMWAVVALLTSGFFAVTLTAQVDRFGGDTARATRATERFRLEQMKDRWWLVTPEGHGMVVLGLNHISEMKNPADYPRTIFAQKFGKDWSRVFAEVERQVREWGFNSAGFQAPSEMKATMPYILGTKFVDASFWLEKLAYTDIFSPEFAAAAEIKAKAAAAEMKANPMCIAWTWTDSTCWDLRLTRKSHGTDYVSFMRGLPNGAPGRLRYTAFLRERHRDIAQLNTAYGTDFSSYEDVARADWSMLDRERATVFADDREFLRLIARHYYQTVATPFRREHPHGLLMGDRFHSRDYPDEVLEEAAKFIDVLGIQPGDHFQPSIEKLSRPDETQFDAREFDRLHMLTGKPIIIADHQCGFFDDQIPKTGGWHQYANAEEAASSYERFLRDAFAQPYVIGYFRCQYLTSYKDHTRRFKQGLLRPDGTPYEEFVRRLSAINRETMTRMHAMP